MDDYNLRNNRNIINIHQYNRNIINIHQSTTNVRYFSIKCNGPRIWNDIDIAIRDARRVDIFKAKLKQHYLENIFSKLLHLLHFVFVIFNSLLLPF